jgi:hypothetical protein
MVTLFAVLCGLVVQPIRANAFSVMNGEQFFPRTQRVCKSTDHYLHGMSMLRPTPANTAIRTRLMLSPDLEVGQKREKHEDVLLIPCRGDVSRSPRAASCPLR